MPIIHSLLRNWDSCSNLRIPHALIIAPTRELALQISTVIREVCVKVQQICAQYQATRSADVATSDTPMDSAEDNAVVTTEPVKLSKKAKKALNKKNKKNAAASGALPLAKVCIEIVSIVGGMSEQKQRRQLAGRGKPVHIVVATPGRLCEMFEDADNVSFQDMSRLKFLVVDEADRIMEEGHYAEVPLCVSTLYFVVAVYQLSFTSSHDMSLGTTCLEYQESETFASFIWQFVLYCIVFSCTACSAAFGTTRRSESAGRTP